MNLQPIAYYEGCFDEKFGIPKQSGLVNSIMGRIVMEPQYRSKDYLRGIEGFSHLWLLWGFSANKRPSDSPLVRPPLLGGNEKVGVFASRSPFRPNPIGLSAVRLDHIDWDTVVGSQLVVTGADLMNHTPIYDIKPYLPLADRIDNARGGFTDNKAISYLEVQLSPKLESMLNQEQVEALKGALRLDPRPHYHNDASRIYRFDFAGQTVAFTVDGGNLYAMLNSEYIAK